MPTSHIFAHVVYDFVVMAPKQSTEVLSSVPKWKKAVMYLKEKILVLEQFHSVMGYSAVGWLAMNLKFINQQYILNKGPFNRNT